MVNEALIHKISDPTTFEDFEEIARCYAEVYCVEIFVRHDVKVMTRLASQDVSDAVDQTLKETVYAYMGTNTLIVIDDCASGQDVKNRTSELVKLGFSARHYKLSTIVLTQQLTSVAKPYRENLSRIVTFHNVNKHDMKILSESYLSNTSKETIAEILQDLKDNKYACLEIDLRHPWDYRIKK